MVAQAVEEFVRASLPPPPARVLEVGAGSGELARLLAGGGYDVVAIDPAGEDDVLPIALLDVAEPEASFDAAVAVVSLHHVEPFGPSCRRLAEVVRPGGTLVVDEFDVARFDEPSAAWLLERWRETGQERDRDPAEMVAELQRAPAPAGRRPHVPGRVVRARADRPRRLPLPLVPRRRVPGGRGGADRRRLDSPSSERASRAGGTPDAHLSDRDPRVPDRRRPRVLRERPRDPRRRHRSRAVSTTTAGR